MIQSGTAVAVGWRAQNKVLGSIGKLCKNVKAKAIQFAQDNPLAKPQDYKRLLLKATYESTFSTYDKQINYLNLTNYSTAC